MSPSERVRGPGGLRQCGECRSLVGMAHDAGVFIEGSRDDTSLTDSESGSESAGDMTEYFDL